MPTKAYFIGLGGCGLKTVADLQQRLCPTGDFSEYKFTYVDTDDATVSKLNEHKVIIRPSDLINVGDTNPYQVYLNAKGGRSRREKRFMEWGIEQGNLDDSRIRFTLPNNYLSDGARGQRMIGRTAVHHRYDDIYREIEGKIKTFFEHDSHNAPNQIPQVWVVASSCGGTGSSMTMDILYILDKIVNSTSHSSPELKLVLFMPKPFIDANSGNPDYPLNAFSYMWELNAFRLDFQQGVNDRFCHFAVDPNEPSGLPFPLYKFIIPVDVETSFGTRIPLDSLYPTVAELIYYCNKGTAAQEMMSNISNDQNQLLNALTENSSTPFKWTRSLVPYGYRVIRKANDEFKKYMSIRAYYEVLKYGVLGEEMSKDAGRDKAKESFAKEYILKYLCDIPELNVTANESSLQSDITEISDSGVMISPNGLDKLRIQNALRTIEELETELKNVLTRAENRIEKSIDRGVHNAIFEHGLRYAKELLHNVDDFYLETIVLPILRADLAKVQEAREIKKSECDAICASYKEKQAATAAKVLGEYKDLTARYHTLTIAIKLIDDSLTAYPMGYLEVLRKGGVNCVGLQKIITKVETEVSNAYDEYISLAKSFIETGKDALTEYLPNLSSIAKGGNDTYWAKDSLFETMYYDSILGYDINHELETRERVPARKNERDNNLKAFIECVCGGEVSILKLAQDDDRHHFERNFADWILSPLHKKIDEAVNKNGTLASQWLRLTLEESFDAENMLPNNMTKEQFLHSMANRDRIPVLYPMVAGATRPSQVRIMYAGASESLAQALGYNPQDLAGNKFVQDEEMNDRFLLIKMPLGLDFYSYKYFQEIQKEYIVRSQNIVSGMYGCHIHKEFSCLNLTKAVEKVQQQKYLGYVRPLFSAVFMQSFLDLLKKNYKSLYDRLWGEFNIDDIFSQGSSQLSDDPFGIGSIPETPFANSGFEVLGGQDDNKYLFNVSVNRGSETLLIKINKLSKIENHLAIIDELNSFEITEFKSFTAFLDNLVAENMLESINGLVMSIGILKNLLKDDDEMMAAYNSLFKMIRDEMMANPLLKLALKWRNANNPSETAYFAIIQEILKGRI